LEKLQHKTFRSCSSKNIITFRLNSPITKGIENLFSETTLKNAIQYKQAFIDITQKITKTVRGEQVIEPEKWEVNLDEKGNLCDYLCKQGDPNDFKEFSRVFSLIEETFS
jgi:predicted methyltransferase